MPESPPRILIADDEPLFLRTTGQLLRKAGYDCVCVADATAALEALNAAPFDLVLSDLNMPGNLQLELLQAQRSSWPETPLIVVTGMPSLPSAIESVRLGIADYLLKPVRFDDLLHSVRRALAHRTDSPAITAGSPEAQFTQVIGDSQAMQSVRDICHRVAASNANVLITGESGTGKEVLARSLHEASTRAAGPFQVIDCTAVPEALFESVLFGHVKGAFTGATADQPGLLRRSDGGTAFFDEIGELSLPLQAKLLRVIQEQTFTPVGKNEPTFIDTRFICATNRDLAAEVAAGRFRRDLFYRLAVVHLVLPPLRQRDDDVLLLANHFLRQLAPAGVTLTLSEDAAACLRRYSWPGNVRELRNAIEHALALRRSDRIELGDLPVGIQHAQATPLTIAHSREAALENAEREYLIALLRQNEGNVAQSARVAGLSRQGLHKLLQKHQLAADSYRP